jgi:hypothetical protein
MTIQEIKATVDQGIEVFWSNVGYTVVKDSLGQYLIKHHTGNCVGLTNQAGDTLNGNEEDFFTWIKD